MSYDAVDAVLKESQTNNPTTLAVAVAIALHADKEDAHAWPGGRRIQKFARCKKSSIYRAVKELQELGELEKVGKVGHATKWRLCYRGLGTATSNSTQPQKPSNDPEPQFPSDDPPSQEEIATFAAVMGESPTPEWIDGKDWQAVRYTWHLVIERHEGKLTQEEFDEASERRVGELRLLQKKLREKEGS